MRTCGSSYDTVLTLWQGDRGAITETACNDAAGCAPQSELVDVAVAGGVRYTLQVTDRGSEAGGGTLQVQLQSTVPVPVELTSFTVE